jgi:hypothetical protein
MRRVLIVLLPLLAGCAGPGPRFEVAGLAAAGSPGYAGPVLARAEADVLGGAGGASLDAASALPGAAGTLAVAVVHARRLDSQVVLEARAQVEESAARFGLPDGLGVFTDPMRVEIRAVGVGGEVGVRREVKVGSGRVGLGVALGASRVAARVHVRSALIDRRSRVVLLLPHAAASARVPLPGGAAAVAEVRLYRTGAVELRLGANRRF